MGRVKSTPRASNRRKKSRLPVTFPNNVAVTKPSKVSAKISSFNRPQDETDVRCPDLPVQALGNTPS